MKSWLRNGWVQVAIPAVALLAVIVLCAVTFNWVLGLGPTKVAAVSAASTVVLSVITLYYAYTSRGMQKAAEQQIQLQREQFELVNRPMLVPSPLGVDDIQPFGWRFSITLQNVGRQPAHVLRMRVALGSDPDHAPMYEEIADVYLMPGQVSDPLWLRWTGEFKRQMVQRRPGEGEATVSFVCCYRSMNSDTEPFTLAGTYTLFQTNSSSPPAIQFPTDESSVQFFRPRLVISRAT